MNRNLVALKTLRYPRGPDGKEYKPGDAFTALSDRDAKALTLVRAAKDAEAAKSPRVEVRSMTAETESQDSSEDRPRRRYMRRDMLPDAS